MNKLFLRCAVLLTMSFLPPNTSAETRVRRIACKTSENANSCYWTRGRLSFYNGVPAFRIWKFGTHHLLGVFSGRAVDRAKDNESPEFPPEFQRVFRPGSNWIVAEFEVCPLEPVGKGKMQAACVETAKDIVVKK